MLCFQIYSEYKEKQRKPSGFDSMLDMIFFSFASMNFIYIYCLKKIKSKGVGQKTLKWICIKWQEKKIRYKLYNRS